MRARQTAQFVARDNRTGGEPCEVDESERVVEVEAAVGEGLEGGWDRAAHLSAEERERHCTPREVQLQHDSGGVDSEQAGRAVLAAYAACERRVRWSTG